MNEHSSRSHALDGTMDIFGFVHGKDVFQVLLVKNIDFTCKLIIDSFCLC